MQNIIWNHINKQVDTINMVPILQYCFTTKDQVKFKFQLELGGFCLQTRKRVIMDHLISGTKEGRTGKHGIRVSQMLWRIPELECHGLAMVPSFAWICLPQR